MELRVRKHADIYILDLIGELDLYNTGMVKDAFKRMVEKQARKIIFNLEQVVYLDSSGLGALIQANGEAEHMGIPLVFCGITGQTRTVFELTRLSRFFNQTESLEQALAWFDKK